VWTVNDAICVLADVEPDRAPTPRAPLPSWIDPVYTDNDFRRPRLPKLTPRPVTAQLTLFD
jgi:hypothetical protein